MSVEVIVPPPVDKQFKINWTLNEAEFKRLTKALGALSCTELYKEYVELAAVYDTLDT